MLTQLPADVLGQALQALDVRDCLRLRASCRHLRAAVSDRLVFDGDVEIVDVSHAFAAFVHRVAGFRPGGLTISGGVCWPAMLHALAALAPSLRRLRVDGASVDGGKLARVLAATSALRELRLRHLVGGRVAVPALPPSLRSLDVRAGMEDPWVTDISVYGVELQQASSLRSLRLVLDKPYGTAHVAWSQLASRAGLRELWLVHWGSVDMRDLYGFEALETLSLHAPRFRGLVDDLELPTVKRACLPCFLWRHALRWFPGVQDLVLCAGHVLGDGDSDDDSDDDDPGLHIVCMNLQFLTAHPPLTSLTLYMNRVDSLVLLAPDMPTFRRFTDAVAFRVLSASIVDVRLMCEDGADVEVSVLADTDLGHGDLHDAVLTSPPWPGNDALGAVDLGTIAS